MEEAASVGLTKDGRRCCCFNMLVRCLFRGFGVSSVEARDLQASGWQSCYMGCMERVWGQAPGREFESEHRSVFSFCRCWLQGVRQIACGAKHVLALCDTGDVYSWGSGRSGQLGLGKRTSYMTPQLVWGMMRAGASDSWREGGQGNEGGARRKVGKEVKEGQG